MEHKREFTIFGKGFTETMFTIQLGHIKINTLVSREFPTLRDWYFHVFREQDEAAFLFVNGIPVRLRYKQDISAGFDQVLAMCWLLQKETKGQTIVTLDAHIVHSSWKLYWEDKALLIQMNWTAKEPLYEAYAAALNAQNELHTQKEKFLAEWNTLLHQLIVVLEKSGCEVANGTERRKKELLVKTENNIQTYGLRYTR